MHVVQQLKINILQRQSSNLWNAFVNMQLHIQGDLQSVHLKNAIPNNQREREGKLALTLLQHM